MKKFQFIILLEEAEVERKPRMTATGTTGTVIAVTADWTILAWASTCPIKRKISNVVDRTVALWIEWVHLVEHHIPLFLVALQTNVEVLYKHKQEQISVRRTSLIFHSKLATLQDSPC